MLVLIYNFLFADKLSKTSLCFTSDIIAHYTSALQAMLFALPTTLCPWLGLRELHLFLMRWVPAGLFTSCQMMLFLQLLQRLLSHLTKQIGCSSLRVFIRLQICCCLSVLLCLPGLKNKRSHWIDCYQISLYKKEIKKEDAHQEQIIFYEEISIILP